MGVITGQTITISIQDEKSLRVAYDFLAGYSDRVLKAQEIEHKVFPVTVDFLKHSNSCAQSPSRIQLHRKQK